MKDIIRKNFKSFTYFYSFLRYRIFLILFFSLFIGVMDGFGLTMFLPLLQMASNTSEVDPESLGNLKFLVTFLQDIGIPLSIFPILCLMLFFFSAKGVLRYFSGIYSVNVREWFMRNLRMKNISGLNDLNYEYFVMSDSGRIQNTLTGEVDRVAISYQSYIQTYQDAILVAVYMGFAFTMNAQFALLVSVGGILANFLYKNLYKNTKTTSRELTGENNFFQSLIIQQVANYKYLKATGSLEAFNNKLKDSVLKIRNSNRRIGKLSTLLVAGREPILVIVVATVIFIQTSVLGSALGPILVSLLFFYRALDYLMQLQIKWNTFLAVSGSLENMKSFEKELRQNKEKQGVQNFNEKVEKIELRNLFFSYKGKQVLKNISLDINRNETIAFVGESGSGKTTLVNIIAGLLPVNMGDFIINGKNQKNISLTRIQEKMGYITQDPVVFNDTIFNNVSFWSEKDQDNVNRFWIAARRSAIADFVQGLPEKEQTVLGNNGANLSGGQRQRISIARELFKDVEVLILDEATSALDSETEMSIKESIANVMGSYTILIVAHRISTIKNADKIVVMKAGEILDIGDFPTLLEKSEYFKRLVDLQGV